MSSIPMTWRELQREALACSTKRCSGCVRTKPLAEFIDPIREKERKTCAACRQSDQALKMQPRVTDAEARALFSVFRQWQGGAPRSDWRASVGVRRDAEVWAGAA